MYSTILPLICCWYRRWSYYWTSVHRQALKIRRNEQLCTLLHSTLDYCNLLLYIKITY